MPHAEASTTCFCTAQAYQVLSAGGVPDDHIVVMVYDDIAGSFQNPHQGQLFNRPGGPDVYQGMPKVSKV